jgi:hypothetical protein
VKYLLGEGVLPYPGRDFKDRKHRASHDATGFWSRCQLYSWTTRHAITDSGQFSARRAEASESNGVPGSERAPCQRDRPRQTPLEKRLGKILVLRVWYEPC